MALIIGTTQSSANGLYNLAAGDNFVLPANIVAQSTASFGVATSTGGHNFTIDGTLIGQTGVVFLGNDESDIGNHLTINSTGVVALTGTLAFVVRNSGGQATIVNAGLIAGEAGIIMQSNTGTGSTIINSGRHCCSYG